MQKIAFRTLANLVTLEYAESLMAVSSIILMSSSLKTPKAQCVLTYRSCQRTQYFALSL